MKQLYPPIDADAIQLVPVGAGHCLYVEECGRPDGVPVVFLHGGPGSGCVPDHRRYFDPSHYRILLFDQRGSGRSTPVGDTDYNSTRELVGDLEQVRRALGVDRWILFGEDWGATLALVYAQTYGSSLLGLVLCGVGLAQGRDLEWRFGPDGAARLLPDAWCAFREALPPGERNDPLGAYRRRTHSADPEVAIRAARAWTAWGNRIAGWDCPSATVAAPPPESQPEEMRAPPLVATSRIETHYAQGRYFLDEGQLLANTGRLPAVPVTIVHGCRDLVSPPDCAWALHRALPRSRLTMVHPAGHRPWEPATIDALVGEADRLRALAA